MKDSRTTASRLACAIDALEPRLHLASTWQNVQIGGGGYVTGLASSSDGSAIYMRTDVGGAYRWTAATGSWKPITDSLPAGADNSASLYGINSLAVDPANANRVFIAAGKDDYTTPSGLYYSTNTNATTPTWTLIDGSIRAWANGAVRQNGERLLVDPNNSNVIYYGTNNISGYGTGLMKYAYGTSWAAAAITTPAYGDAKYGITFVAADKNGGTVTDSGGRTVSKYLYVGVWSATAGQGGVYASSNGGSSWTKVGGVVFDKPNRGEVGVDGTLYVTYDGGVARLMRGSTTFAAIAPPGGNTDFCSLAVDPAVAGTVMIADFTFGGYGTVWRSLDSGSTWIVMNRNVHGGEPDGTPSATGSGATDHVSDLLINPANLDEVWAADFLGVSRTQNIQDNATTASEWYLLQKNHEEVVVLDLKSAPSGAPLASAVADVGGFMHANVDVRPTKAEQFDAPYHLSSTSLDFSEATSGSSTVWARTGVLYWTGGGDLNGGFSLDDGMTWAEFGELSRRSVFNATTAGWEAFDVAPYLKQQKANGINTVTLVVESSSSQTNQYGLSFSSKEGGNAPQLLVNGSTTITVTADTYVAGGSQGSNYGTGTTLYARDYYGQDWCHNITYLKFDLGSVSSISDASLRLYRLAGAGTYNFTTTIGATPNTSWTETGMTWTNRPTDLYAPPAEWLDRGGRIAVSATDPGSMVWLMEDGDVWYTKDRGVRWARGTAGGTNLTVTYGMEEFQVARSALASDRVAANTFYVFSNAGNGTVYRSTDGGATWTSIATNTDFVWNWWPNGYKLETLPGVSGRFWLMTQPNINEAGILKYWNGTALQNVQGITDVVQFAFGKPVDGRTNPTVFVRKEDGTYWYSLDATGGSTFTWTQVNAPALGCSPSVMEGDRQRFGRFYVGTGGRGIYYIDIATAPAAPTNASATANSSSQISVYWTDNASNESNYRIERKTGSGGTWAEIASIGANSTSYVNTGLAAGTQYYYRVRATNAAGDSAYSNEASATTTVSYPATIMQEVWTGIYGDTIASIPVSTTPNSYKSLSTMEVASSAGDNYGTRIRGYFVPQTTGSYTFWISSDNAGELWLSTSTDPAAKSRIASVSTYTAVREWNKQTTQKSAAVTLTAGLKYYMEALMKEGTGGDNLAVAYKVNNTTAPANGDGSNIIPSTLWQSYTPTVNAEMWTGLTGSGIGTIPTGTTPSRTVALTSMEIPTDAMDNYGTRIRGYFVPQTTGNYTFWIAADDDGELWLSNSTDPAGKTKIAYVAGWTASREWGKQANQKSATIALTAGQKYYIEALMREVGGGDNLAVAVQLNNSTTPATGDGSSILSASQMVPWGGYVGSPFASTPLAIASSGSTVMQAEDFDRGGEGVAYHDLEAANQGGSYRTGEGVDIQATSDTGGGYNVGYIRVGEWMKYSVNVAATGNYNVTFRVAASAAGRLHLENEQGLNITGAVNIASTGGWQNWADVTVSNVLLQAGKQTLKLVFDTEGFNVNYIRFTRV